MCIDVSAYIGSFKSTWSANNFTVTSHNVIFQHFAHPDALREAQNALKDANRQLNELTAIRAQLEAERDSLQNALRDTEDALRDAENKLAAAQQALNQLRTDMENRLREKDEEIESIR